jgi:protein TonB
VQAKKRRYFVSLSVSLFFHGLLFMLVSLNTSTAPESAALKEPERFLSLVNISLPEPPQPEEQSALSVPAALPVTVSVTVPDAVPVEDFIVVEESIELAEGMESIEEGIEEAPALFPETAAGSMAAGIEAGAQRPAENTERGSEARTAGYVRRNYTYIQRRIRDKLVYPPQARRAGIQGTTEVGFIIHKDGSVSGVTVRAGSGHAILDEGAVAAVFAAAPFPKPPAPARIVIPVSFKLR